MVYTFKLVRAPLQLVEQGHLLTIRADALAALCEEELDTKGAWALCEYLDIVDAGELEVDRPVYRQATAALGEYLATPANHRHAQTLQDKSWAANTLGKILSQRSTDSPRQLVA